MTDEMDEEELELTHSGVHVYKQGHVIVPTIADQFADDERDHAMIFHYLEGEDSWTQHLIDTHSISGICVIEEPKPKALNLAIDGTIFVVEGPFAKVLNAALEEDEPSVHMPGFSIERIAPKQNGPTRATFLTCIRKIGARVYSAGLARQVYRRDSPNRWVRVDDGVYVPPGQRKQGIGFASIDGVDEKGIYAVGYKGEIWFYDGVKWAQLDSPTNVYLSQVRCVSKLETYACGMAGTVLRGNKNGWEPLLPDYEAGDFWGMAVLDNRVYVAGEEGIAVVDGDIVRLIDMRLDPQPSTMYLDSGDGIMWSVGQKDIARSHDGVSWEIVPSP